MGRFAAIALVNLRVELASPHAYSMPLAIVIARPGGAVKDEASLLGNTRLDEVSPEAYRLGIHPGQTVASARARSAELRVRVVPLESVEKTLAGLAEMALAFGPTTAFEMATERNAGDVVWVDVTGCGHLHEGEPALLSRLVSMVEAMGHACRAAIADGPRVAAAVARFAEERSRGPIFVVPAGENVSALANLPLAALGLEEKTHAWMSALGLRRISDLQRLPRASLGARLGRDAARVMALLEGDDRAPLVAYVPPEVPTEEAELEYGIESSEALLFVAKRLAGRLAARLEGRCQKAMRLELGLGLDLGTSCREKHHLEVMLASPLAREDELFGVLRTKIEAQGASFRAPIVSVLLRATSVVTARAEALDLLVPQAKAARALPKLASELMAELGPERVGTLALANTWVMEERSRLLPFGVSRSRWGDTRQTPRSRWGDTPRAFQSGGAEPTRLLAKPKGIKRAELVHSRLVARFEAVEWWRHGLVRFGAPAPKHRGRIEHYASWLEEKRSMAWVEIEGESAKLKGFID